MKPMNITLVSRKRRTPPMVELLVRLDDAERLLDLLGERPAADRDSHRLYRHIKNEIQNAEENADGA